MAINMSGRVSLFSYDFCPEDWVPADGRQMSIMNRDNHMLFSLLGRPLRRRWTQHIAVPNLEAPFSLLGDRYGGDGRNTFAVPNLEAPESVTQERAGPKKTQKLQWCVAVKGTYPPRTRVEAKRAAQGPPFLPDSREAYSS